MQSFGKSQMDFSRKISISI